MRVFCLITYILILFIAFFSIHNRVFAGEYVLPYPSFMPGNKFYKVTRILDSIERWWYWGSIASFKYHLKLSDKYLIEAKTLFEYKQYQLGVDALKRSDAQIPQVIEFLHSARKEGKDVQKLKIIASDAMVAHALVLEKLSSELPKTYLWTPEKERPVVLDFSLLLNESLAMRKKLLE